GCLYFDSPDDLTLERTMKAKKHRFKFYDIYAETVFHGVRELANCLECQQNTFKVEYLGSDEVFVNDNWLDISSYSRRWGFTTENSEELLDRVTEFTKGAALDLFGGSGTTAAVAMKKNRQWVSAEVGSQGVDVIVPRLKAVMAGEDSGISKSSGWKGGGAFKYCYLETYEDSLANLNLARSEQQDKMLFSNATANLREQYTLRYMLDVEARNSPSLLNIGDFSDPTAYKLKVKRPGSDESREVNVDLIETFNWLIGLSVQHIAAPRTFAAEFEKDTEGRLQIKGRLKQDKDGPFWFRTVMGTLPDGRKTLVVWRKLTGNPSEDNLVLDTWLTDKLQINPRDMEFDLIYVNGDNNLENMKLDGDKWKVRLIEEDLHRLMFDTEDA
ncbi:MAG: site-specific DNA-methyltransferase, partial [Acidobacteria bacterium]|nr:site-specific DNA-methyltransferase [Acidobacteriota bacterium]